MEKKRYSAFPLRTHTGNGKERTVDMAQDVKELLDFEVYPNLDGFLSDKCRI